MVNTKMIKTLVLAAAFIVSAATQVPVIKDVSAQGNTTENMTGNWTSAGNETTTDEAGQISTLTAIP